MPVGMFFKLSMQRQNSTRTQRRWYDEEVLLRPVDSDAVTCVRKRSRGVNAMYRYGRVRWCMQTKASPPFRSFRKCLLMWTSSDDGIVHSGVFVHACLLCECATPQWCDDPEKKGAKSEQGGRNDHHTSSRGRHRDYKDGKIHTQWDTHTRGLNSSKTQKLNQVDNW